ncbi:MAG: 3-phosphoglycerate dehydrogenase family protein [Phycisphaerales bacterium]|nr:3-phosphoglycerate dehydrogenase family protein [Phycisphaerales bacterium]MCI0630708.1 3-phosphoglycerate dehydrogenase family protein [Phycisphaerales bacterium]MCI0677328.1 3-phosphoglycerate dehydrogenase family protein [Phycisphaerales bacterium]
MTTTPTRTSIPFKRNSPGTPTTTTSVLIADKFESAGVEGLTNLGCEVKVNPDLAPETLPAALAESEADILIVRSTKVPAAVFEKAKKLNLVVRAGAGFDNIDVAAASAKGIFVANCPGKNAIAVAELAWALILSCDRRVPDQTTDLRAGKWSKKEYAKAAGLFGRTLGIVGLGQIGQEVAARGRAFGMNVVAWSRSLTEEKADALDVGYVSNIINLAKMSDVISVNVASTPETKHLINEQFCNAMKPGAYFINTSRGSVVDQAALTNAIRTKGVRCGLDVFASEPPGGEGSFTDPIAKERGVYGTHHIGASTDQAQQAIARETVRIVAEYVKSGRVLNCVNRAAATPATCLLTVRHLNRPGVLAHIFYTLGQAGINVEEMENIIYEGTQAACARIQLDQAPRQEHLTAIGANESVLSVALTSIAAPR